MRHRKSGRKLGRSSAHRKALLRNLTIALFEHGRIRTTVPKAKEVTPFVHRLITLARKGTLAHRRHAVSLLPHKLIIQKLFRELAPQFSARNGGYTRIIRLPQNRLGDNAETCYLELITEEAPVLLKSRGWARNRKRNNRKFKSGAQDKEIPKEEAQVAEPVSEESAHVTPDKANSEETATQPDATQEAETPVENGTESEEKPPEP
ncbi:MAG: 50S ribosomal protein L17 [Planctomycetota bacterium]|jgi:large subunit ribosomal protein L17